MTGVTLLASGSSGMTQAPTVGQAVLSIASTLPSPRPRRSRLARTSLETRVGSVSGGGQDGAMSFFTVMVRRVRAERDAMGLVPAG